MKTFRNEEVAQRVQREEGGAERKEGRKELVWIVKKG
jgi:hypothetical protein